MSTSANSTPGCAAMRAAIARAPESVRGASSSTTSISSAIGRACASDTPTAAARCDTRARFDNAAFCVSARNLTISRVAFGAIEAGVCASTAAASPSTAHNSTAHARDIGRLPDPALSIACSATDRDSPSGAWTYFIGCRSPQPGRRSNSTGRANSGHYLRRSRFVAVDAHSVRAHVRTADAHHGGPDTGVLDAGRGTSDVEVAHAERVVLDERAARLDFLAHQRREDLLGGDRVLDLYPEQPPHLRIHRRLPQLLGIHLAEALVTLDGDAPARFVEQPFERLAERGDRALLVAALHHGARMEQVAYHVGRRGDLHEVAARDQVGIDRARVRRAVGEAHDDDAPRAGRGVVAGLDAHVRIGDRLFERRGARLRTGFAREIDANTAQQCFERRRVDDARESLGHRFGEQVIARDARERLRGERRAFASRHELRALQRDFEQMLLQLVIVLEVGVLASLANLVQRRLRDVDVATLNQLGHLPVEKRQQQRADVRAVDIGVGHDDDAVIAQLVRVEDVLLVLVAVGRLAEAGAERGDQRDDFLRRQQLLDARPLHVENLAAKRQDRLELAVASLLRRSARGIALDQIDFAQRGIALLAVCELAGQSHAVEHALAARQLARLAGGFARARGLDDLRADDPRVVRMLEQEVGELRRNGLLHDRHHLGGHELVLRLRAELGLGYLDREHAGQTLAHVVAGRLDLRLLRDLFLLDVVVERARHRLAQPGQMRAAVALRNVVGEDLDVLDVRVVPLHRDFDGGAVLFADAVEHLRMQHRLAAVHVLDEALHAAGILEVLALAVALVDQLDRDAVVEERQLSDALGEDLVVIFDAAERLDRRHEMDFGAATVGVADHGERCDGLAAAKLHLVHFAAAPDAKLQPVGKRVHDRHADPVQPAGYLVAVLIELAARVQLGHHDLGGRALLLVIVLDVGRDAAAVVDDRYRIVGMDHDLDVVAIAGERLVDRVVEHLEHHVVQAGSVRRVADVHAGALAHRVETLQDLDAVGVVIGAIAIHCELLVLRWIHLRFRFGAAQCTGADGDSSAPVQFMFATRLVRFASASRRTCSRRGPAR